MERARARAGRKAKARKVLPKSTPRSKPGKPVEASTPPVGWSSTSRGIIETEGLTPSGSSSKLEHPPHGLSQNNARRTFDVGKGKESRACPEMDFRVPLRQGAILTVKKKAPMPQTGPGTPLTPAPA